MGDLCRAALLINGRDCPNERGAMIGAALSTGRTRVIGHTTWSAIITMSGPFLLVDGSPRPRAGERLAAVATLGPGTGNDAAPTVLGGRELLGPG